MKSMFLSVALVTLLMIAGQALAHGGGLDRNGCHRDNSTGGYHCH